MKHTYIALLSLSVIAFTSSPVRADTNTANAEEVVAKVEEAVALIRTGGKAALETIADPSQG